jgi:hypothetical protein
MYRFFYIVFLLSLLSYSGFAQQTVQGNISGLSKEPVSVYPNPARNNFYVETYSYNPNKTCNISVLNIIGQSIFSQTVSGEENGYIRCQVLLNSDTPKGLYFVKVDDEVNEYKIIRLKIE